MVESYRVKDVKAVRYFLECGDSDAAQRGYERLTEIVAETGALVVSEKMLLEYMTMKESS